jgi:hypothetical protein
MGRLMIVWPKLAGRKRLNVMNGIKQVLCQPPPNEQFDYNVRDRRFAGEGRVECNQYEFPVAGPIPSEWN